MSKRRQDSEIVFLQANAGFSLGRAFGWILPEPEYILKSPSPYCRADVPLPIALADNSPCPPDCGDSACREWCNIHIL